MVQSYVITSPKIVYASESSLMKNVILKSGPNKVDRISKCVERTTDLKTINRLESKVLNECYIDLSLDKLRELDSDVVAQENYICKRSRFLDKGMLNVLMIKLRLVQGIKLNDQDYEYLNALLNWNQNDIYVMPILEFEGESIDRVARVREYDEFVTKMLEMKASWFRGNINIGMSIPQYYPRRPLESLFELYHDEKPTFVAMDFNNARMDKPDGKVATVLNHFFTEKEEKTFLYGVNVKPYKRGLDSSSAWDIYMVHGMFNAIGPTHSKPRKFVSSNDWKSMGRIYDYDNISYPKMDDQHRDSFISWVEDNYQIELDKDFSKNEKNLYAHLKRHNFEMTNKTLSDITSAINKGDTEYLDDVRGRMPDEMKNVVIVKNFEK